MTDYFWAWQKLKRRREEELVERPSDDIDYELLDSLLSYILKPQKHKGDGKFDRARRYVAGLNEYIAWMKQNWRGDSEILTAFLLGLEVAFESVGLELDVIAK